MTVRSERRTKAGPLIKWYVLGPLTAAVSLPALMYLCAVLLAREVLPYGLMEELVIACVFFASALGGAAAAAGRGGKVLQTGAAIGAAVAGAIVIAALAAPGEGPLNSETLKHVIAALCGGAFGGALSLRRGGGKKRRRRK